jgi:integrase/recombinase XerC
MAEVGRRQDHKALSAIRDRALLRMLNGMGLRRAEVVSLDLDHVDLDAGTLAVLGKGKRERVRLTIPRWAGETLAAWIEARGAASGPLFTSIGKSGRIGGRLTGDGVRYILATIGASVGVKVRPHGLRHTAITALLDSGADVRDVQKFSRHADLNTLLTYDDNREDKFGKMAAIVDALV